MKVLNKAFANDFCVYIQTFDITDNMKYRWQNVFDTLKHELHAIYANLDRFFQLVSFINVDLVRFGSVRFHSDCSGFAPSFSISFYQFLKSKLTCYDFHRCILHIYILFVSNFLPYFIRPHYISVLITIQCPVTLKAFLKQKYCLATDNISNIAADFQYLHRNQNRTSKLEIKKLNKNIRRLTMFLNFHATKRVTWIESFWRWKFSDPFFKVEKKFLSWVINEERFY